jgi:hypothetical protein
MPLLGSHSDSRYGGTMKKIVLSLCCIAALASISSAESSRRTTASERTASSSMQGKFGLGFNNQLSDLGLSSLSLRYWNTNKLGFEGIFGFSLGDNTIIDLGGKVLGVIKKDQNVTVYGFGLIGIESFDIKNGANDTNFTIGGGLGTEFFFPGLPNLGFGAEIGVGIVSINDNTQFGTSSGWIPQVGMRYYF